MIADLIAKPFTHHDTLKRSFINRQMRLKIFIPYFVTSHQASSQALDAIVAKSLQHNKYGQVFDLHQFGLARTDNPEKN